MRALVALVVVAFAVGCAKESAAPAAKVEAKVEQKAEQKVADAVGGERVAFDNSHGKIGFVASKVTLTHFGGFAEFAGVVTLPAGEIEGGSVEVTIQAASIFSDAEKLTGHLQSADFFDVENIPEASFKSTKIAKADEDYSVTGDLNIHGVTKSVTFPAKISADAEKLSVAAVFTINRQDFDLKYPGMPDNLIRDNVELSLALEVPRGAVNAEAEAEVEAAAVAEVPL